MNIFKNKDITNAIVLGIMCTLSYLGCYIAKNILGVVTPSLIEESLFTVEEIGTLSTGYMLCYAMGQIINGRVGDMIKTKYMVGTGLSIAGFCYIIIANAPSPLLMTFAYSVSGFFLAMIYAPIMKAVSENTKPEYASRCTLGFIAASFLGTPIASFIATFFDWKKVFILCGLTLVLLGVICFFVFSMFEKKGIIKFIKKEIKENKIDFKYLFENSIVKYTIFAALTGIVRTAVVFWIPTYLVQYIGLSNEMAAVIFTATSLLRSCSPYINNLLIYDFILKRNIDKSNILMYTLSTVSFLIMFFVRNPIINTIALSSALLTSAGASTMVFSIYCPSYGKTGMVSTVTGFLDFASYVGAAIANVVFANAVTAIGWGNLILVWAGLMLTGTILSLNKKKFKENV